MNRRQLQELVAWMLVTTTMGAEAALPSASESTYTPGTLQINAPTAWRKGASGTRIVVGVIDTGVNAAHPDLVGQVLGGYNAVNNNSVTTDANGHGTHVAGIIAAAANSTGIVGTAYTAKILPVKIFDDSGRGTSSSLSSGLRYTAGKAKVLNLSLSAGGPVAETELRNAVSRGQLIVAAAGNAGRSNPDWPARYAPQTWANNQILAVGAVDRNNVIASWSNRAGVTQNYYLVAPGTSIMSTYKSGYAYMSGTSMATPHVAGAAAVIWSYWPYLTAKQVATTLLVTATDLGAPGIDAVYGRGLVNLGKAIQPIGISVVRTSNGGFTLARANYTAGTAYASSLSGFARDGGFAMAIEDELGRDFQTDLGGAIAQPAGLTLENMFSQMDQRMNVSDELLADGTRLTLAPSSSVAMSDSASIDADVTTVPGGFALSMPLANGDTWGIGSNGFADRFFGLGSATLTQGPTLDAATLGDPLFSLVSAHSHLGYAYEVGRGFNLRVGMLSDGLRRVYEPNLTTDTAGSSNLWTTELRQQTAARYLSVSVSQLRENEGLLGSKQGDLFALNAAPVTTAASVQGAWRIAPGFAVAGRYTVGYTPSVHADKVNLISDVSDVRTDAFAAGLIRADAWRRGDRLSLTLSQPLRATSGTMSFSTPIGNDADGQMQYEARNVNLETSGRELRTELSYVTPMGKDREVGVVLAHRQQPDHDANAANDNMAAVRWQMRF